MLLPWRAVGLVQLSSQLLLLPDKTTPRARDLTEADTLDAMGIQRVCACWERRRRRGVVLACCL